MSRRPPPPKFGPDNHRWKGGTWTNSKGYPMIWVGRDHPAASCRAYAKAHTLAYYNFHGELPGDGWHIHHHDDDKTNCSPSNLEPKLPGEHGRHHYLQRGNPKAKALGKKGGKKAARNRRRSAPTTRTGTAKSRTRRGRS